MSSAGVLRSRAGFLGHRRAAQRIAALEPRFMADQHPAPDDRFKAEMPSIPGIADGSKPPSNAVAPLKVVGGLVVVVIVIVAAGSLFVHSRRSTSPSGDASSQVEVPAPDLGNPPPQSPPPMRGIATVETMAKPWSSKNFDYRDGLSGERIPSLLLRLPGGSAGQSAGYWAFALKAPYGNCQLELVSDLAKLKGEYGYQAARHPMVGNPCSRSVFDPTKMSNLPGNVWVRGAMVQGSDLRPPLGIEVKIAGKDIIAVRME
jgi:hypothetical protein